MNSQRIKSPSVLVRESLIRIDPKIAHQKIVNDRKAKELGRSLNGLSAIIRSMMGDAAKSQRLSVFFLTLSCESWKNNALTGRSLIDRFIIGCLAQTRR